MARIKFTAAQALQLIQQLGVDAELVADDQATKDLKFDDAIAAVDESRGKILRPDIESELRTELTTSLAGKFGGELRTHLRRLSGNALKSGDLKEMKDEEALQKFLEVMVGQKDQSLEDIRNQMKVSLEEADAERLKQLKEKEDAFSALQEKYIERDRDTVYEQVLSAIPRTGGNIKVQAQAFKAYVRNLYKDHYDDSKKDIDLRDLSNPEKPALRGNIAVLLKDVGTEWAKESGILKGDMRGEDPTKHLGGDGGSSGGDNKASFSGPGDFDKDMQSFEAML
jgi:hypothetical protein